MWRVRKDKPQSINPYKVKNKMLVLAIMHECGTSRATYLANRSALIKLGWIRTKGNKYIILTNKDLKEV